MASPPRTLVTGGTRGIGAAVARRLAACGHQVTALGRRQRAAIAPGVTMDAADVTDPAALGAAFCRANADGQGLTGLVTSAGVWEPTPMSADAVASAPAFRRVFEANVLGTIHAVAALLAHARRGADVSVVLVGSTAGQRGESGYSAYAASKAALNGLAKSWAVELAPRGIRVNVVAPGWVDTEMTEDALGNPANRALIEASIPRGRVATADEIAGPIAFLLSDDARHLTGSVLSVNGGGVLASF